MSALLGQIATIVGLMAGGIAVGGFLDHARLSLNGEPDVELRRMTTLVGLAAVGVLIAVVVG